jgi:hypothetical protein
MLHSRTLLQTNFNMVSHSKESNLVVYFREKIFQLEPKPANKISGSVVL